MVSATLFYNIRHTMGRRLWFSALLCAVVFLFTMPIFTAFSLQSAPEAWSKTAEQPQIRAVIAGEINHIFQANNGCTRSNSDHRGFSSGSAVLLLPTQPQPGGFIPQSTPDPGTAFYHQLYSRRSVGIAALPAQPDPHRSGGSLYGARSCFALAYHPDWARDEHPVLSSHLFCGRAGGHDDRSFCHSVHDQPVFTRPGPDGALFFLFSRQNFLPHLVYRTDQLDRDQLIHLAVDPMGAGGRGSEFPVHRRDRLTFGCADPSYHPPGAVAVYAPSL